MNWWHRWTRWARQCGQQMLIALVLAIATAEHRPVRTPIPVVQSMQWTPPPFPMLRVRAFGPRLV